MDIAYFVVVNYYTYAKYMSQFYRESGYARERLSRVSSFNEDSDEFTHTVLRSERDLCGGSAVVREFRRHVKRTSGREPQGILDLRCRRRSTSASVARGFVAASSQVLFGTIARGDLHCR